MLAIGTGHNPFFDVDLLGMVDLNLKVHSSGDRNIRQVKHGASSLKSHRRASPAVLVAVLCYQANLYCSQST